MLQLGKTKDQVRITLRAAVPAAKGRKAEPEAFIIMVPITAAMRRRASHASRLLLGNVDDIDQVDIDLLGDVAEAGSRELMRLGALEWAGIGDEDNNPLPLTPDRETRLATANKPDRPTGTIDALLADEDLFAIIEDKYIRPDALRRAEKNALSASPNGTGEAATRARTIAGSAANRKTRRAAAKGARTASTRCKPKPAKRSGKS